MAIIEVESLTKYYGDVRGIENLTFQVEKGEVFGYLGPNGAGKTTTIRILLGFLKPTRGQARVLDKDVWEQTVEIKRQVGYVPGDLSLYGNLTGKEFLDYFGRLKGSDPDLLGDLLDRFPIPLERRIEGYSRGMKQMLGIVQAFMNDPLLVVMDEPTSGLDPLMQESLYDFLEREKERGRTIFFSSHNLAEVERVCDRVGIIRLGRLVALEDVQALKTKMGKKVSVRIEGDPNKFRGPEEMQIEDNWIRFVVEGDINPLIRELSRFKILDLEIENFDLEDIFLRYYEGAERRHESGA